jgi:hypothetical protein
MAASDPGAPRFRYDPTERSMFVECSCGWRSSKDRSAGILGAQWDRHVEEDHG